MKTICLINRLAKRYPKSLRSRGDFGGLMCGKLKGETKKVLLCLDYDDEVLPTALKEKPDMIISHHPFIFGTKMRVLNRDEIKAELFKKTEKAGLCVYSMHTNFDSGYPGMNDALAERLGLTNVKPLELMHMARGGELPEAMEIHEFAKMAKERFNVDYGKLINAGTKTIKRVAILGGGGSFAYDAAQKEGYDILISGDAPHHARREMVLRHFNYLDLPHEIEKVFMDRMERTIKEIDPTIEVVKVDHEKLPELI